MKAPLLFNRSKLINNNGSNNNNNKIYISVYKYIKAIFLSWLFFLQ